MCDRPIGASGARIPKAQVRAADSYLSARCGPRIAEPDRSITVSQRKHWKRSKRSLSGCDRLASIASPHSGHCFGVSGALVLNGMTGFDALDVDRRRGDSIGFLDGSHRIPVSRSSITRLLATNT